MYGLIIISRSWDDLLANLDMTINKAPERTLVTKYTAKFLTGMNSDTVMTLVIHRDCQLAGISYMTLRRISTFILASYFLGQ